MFSFDGLSNMTKRITITSGKIKGYINRAKERNEKLEVEEKENLIEEQQVNPLLKVINEN